MVRICIFDGRRNREQQRELTGNRKTPDNKFGYNRAAIWLIVNDKSKALVIMYSHHGSIRDVAQLEELLSEPTDGVVRAMATLRGDILVLGIGGKIGPSLARMAKRASDLAGVNRRVIGVSRFSSSPLEQQLRAWGIETARCDLLNPQSLGELPDAPNVVFMAGMKFGSTGQEWLTWAINTHLPGLVANQFRHSRIAVFSTGNVYGLSPVSRGGSREGDSLNPAGEYAMSCVGRERLFEHFSRANETRISILRLNYAAELRYGVLLDTALRVHAGQPVPLSMGYLNTIWQGDASAMSLESLACATIPPNVINITGPDLLSVRWIAEEFAKRLGRGIRFAGQEASDALLSNAQKAFELFGRPRVSVLQLIDWIADWVSRGGPTLAKPTHFEERAGRF